MALSLLPLCAQPKLRPIAEARTAAPGEAVWRVQCTVTLEPGMMPTEPDSFYCQDGTGGISITGPAGIRLTLHDRVEAQGVVRTVEDEEPAITAARVALLGKVPRLAPRRIPLADVFRPELLGQLVLVRGVVSQNAIGDTRDDVFVRDSARVLRCYFHRPGTAPSVLPSQAPPGAEIEVTGILLPSDSLNAVLRLRSSADITLIRRPNLLLTPGGLAAVGVAGGLVLLAVAWVITLRRSIRSQTAQIRSLLVRAEESSRLKSEFLANLSHEIRTPIHAIQGTLHALSESRLDAEQHEEVGTALDATRHLLDLLGDVLEFSRIEAGKLTLEPRPFDPAAAVRSAARAFEPAARAKGLEVRCSVREVPALVEGDATRLRQVLYNLLSNAVKFSEEGSVGIEAWTTSRQERNITLGFRVTDTGIGIPPEKQAIIFDSFRQVDGSISRRFGGSGLGLAIAQRLVQLMGGELRVSSRLGEGSTFEFTAVFSRPDAMAVAAEPEESEHDGAKPVAALRILLADDNPVNQRLARRMLEKDGHDVVVVPDGQAAVEAASGTRFDAILMDVQMPGMDGFQATAAIRQAEAAGHVPRCTIFAVTAHGMEGDRERCLAAGMDAYLVKPFLPKDLRRLLARVQRIRED